MVIPFVAAAIAAGAAATGGAWAASRMRRERRDASSARDEARAEIRAAEEVLDSRRDALRETTRHYLDAQVEQRLTGVGLDVLREQTDGGVRIAALEEAGFATVADLVGKSAGELDRIPGVGPHTARAVERAVKGYVATARASAPPVPGADLTEPRAEDLARDCLVFLDAWRELGSAPAEMRAGFEELDARVAAGIDRATFLRWMGGALRRGLNRRQAERLHALAAEVEGLRASEPWRRAREARDRLARGGDGRRTREQVREEFRRRYADSAALLERVFSELDVEIDAGRRRRSVSGVAPLQEELARRIEAFPLDTTGLQVMLRRYQAFGARYLLALERTVLGDEMGLGKTIQALAALNHVSRRKEWCCSLVVAPASILGNWAHEIAQRTSLQAHVLHGRDVEEGIRGWARDGGVGVTSYTTLRRNAAEFAHLGPERIEMLVADEAHYVKNPEAGRTRALVRLADRARKVCFMSGTPLENHPEEFVHLLGSLAPKRARDLDAFLKQPGSVLGSARRFHAEMADVYLRRNQEDVLTELPPRIDMEDWVDLRDEERGVYEEQVARRNFMGMRRAVTLGEPGNEVGTAKFERLADLLEEYREEGVKVLLFSYFLDVLEEVERVFGAHGRITGAVPPDRRFAVVQEFQEAEGHRLLVAQIDAAGTGLNLQAAGAVVLMEPQLKPTTEAQAVARAHRMGQTRRVVVHRLLARDSVDERLVELLATKRELFEKFARESLIKDASEEAVATGLARQVMDLEQRRLASD